MNTKRRRSDDEDDEEQLPPRKRVRTDWIVPPMAPRYRPSSLFIEYGPPMNYSSNMFNYCRLCHETIDDPRSQLAITNCNHGFHYECIMDWADDSDRGHQCPRCTQNLVFIVHAFITTTDYTRTTFNLVWRY